MSRLEVPLKYRTLRATGDTVLWADLMLSLKTNQGAWKDIPFRVDPGTEMTTMPAFEARKLDLPIPKTSGVSPRPARPRSTLGPAQSSGRRHGSDRIHLSLLLHR